MPLDIQRLVVTTAAAALIATFAAAAPAHAMDTKKVQKSGPDLTKARALIKAKNWKSAIRELERLRAAGPNADVYNLLGFAHRKQGKFTESHGFYAQALKLDPNHKSAHEYLGELYIQTGKIEKARKQAAILAKLCPQGCEERADLDQSLAAMKKK